jgi:hypothetical protein
MCILQVCGSCFAMIINLEELMSLHVKTVLFWVVLFVEWWQEMDIFFTNSYGFS